MGAEMPAMTAASMSHSLFMAPSIRKRPPVSRGPLRHFYCWLLCGGVGFLCRSVHADLVASLGHGLETGASEKLAGLLRNVVVLDLRREPEHRPGVLVAHRRLAGRVHPDRAVARHPRACRDELSDDDVLLQSEERV